MLKTRRKHLNALIICAVFTQWSFAQAKGGMENYNFLCQDQPYVWMPVLHYENKRGWYGELRYNYEEMRTVSLYGGKIINMGAGKKISLTPMIGFSMGNFEGVSLAINADYETDPFYVSLESQFSHSFNSSYSSFFFNWSEIGYNFSRNLFGGLSMQYTFQEDQHLVEPGLMAGLQWGNLSIPVYFFNPLQKQPTFIVGLNYEFRFKKKVNQTNQ